MQTHVIKLCCQGCGSDLEVDENVRFLTCNYCQSKLEVVRDVSVTHTRVLEKLERTTDRIAGNLKVIELQNDLERMDREWAIARQGMMHHSENGQPIVPSGGGAVITGVMGMVAGGGFALITGLVAAFTGWSVLYVLPVFGLGIFALGLWSSIAGPVKAQEFRSLQERHEAQRLRLIALIEMERQK